MKNAVMKTQEQVYQIIDRYLKEYYTEYTPEYYDRTYQLYKSLVKSEIRQVGNGYECHIYFDLDMLDYNKLGYSDYKILETAMNTETHGGYSAPVNTAIWIESIKTLNKNTFEILKRMLKSEGVPLK